MRTENYVTIAVGQKHSGKTSSCLYYANKNDKPIIVMDVAPHPRYADWEHITIEDLKKWEGDKCRLVVGAKEIIDVFSSLQKYQRNRTILFEDCYRYIDQNIPKEIKAFIVDHRKYNFDIFLMYHALSMVPPFLANMHDVLILHKTGESIQNNLGNKFGNWNIIKTKMERVEKDANEHYFEVIYK